MSYVVEGSIKAFERYRDMLKAKGIKPKNAREHMAGDKRGPLTEAHLLWMCEHCLKNISNAGGMSVDKFSRWLGFVQYGMCQYNYTWVEAEMDWTRPWLRKPEAPVLNAADEMAAEDS